MNKSVYSMKSPLFKLFTYDKSNPMYYLNYYMMFCAIGFKGGPMCYCFQIGKKKQEITISNIPVADLVYKADAPISVYNNIIVFILAGRWDFWVADKLKYFGRDDRDELETFNA